jgi:PAS domain S-box-containing protein
METAQPGLRAESDILATMFEVARIGMCVIDQEGRFERVNPALCQMLDYKPAELIGAYYAIAAPPAVAEKAPQFLAAVFSDSAKIPNEWQIRRKDGSLFDALVSFRPVVGANTRRYLLVTFSDISENKRTRQEIENLNRQLERRIAERTMELERKIVELRHAEDALKLSEESTRLVIDTAQDAVVTLNAQGLVTRWNLQAENLFGWSREEVSGRQIWELVVPESLRESREMEYRSFLEASEKTRLSRTFEMPLLHRDGHELQAEITAWPIRIGENREIGAFIRDISARKSAQKAAKDRTAQLLAYRKRLYELASLDKSDFDRALFTTLATSANTLRVMRVGYWCFDTEASRLELRALYRLDQLRLDDSAAGAILLRKDYPDYFAAIIGNRPVVANRAREHLDTRDFGPSYLIPNGVSSMLDTPVWFRGKVVGVLCHEHTGPARDWTPEEVDFATAVANMVSLELEASSRIQAERETLDALAREKEMNEMKSRFVSMTSHEFRTPLTTILSSIELLDDYGERLPATEKAELVAVIKDSVHRMTQMLDDVLLIGKAETGGLTFRPAPLAVAEFFSSVIEEVKMAEKGHHDFQLACSVAGCECIVDEKLLRHIVGNLLTNAAKYSPQGGVIRTQVNCDGRELTFLISDQGIGIPAEDQARLFESFHRGANVGNIAGSGLGLAIVKKAVDLHSGKILVTSSVGKGTTFTVTIPATQVFHGQNTDS